MQLLQYLQCCATRFNPFSILHTIYIKYVLHIHYKQSIYFIQYVYDIQVVYYEKHILYIKYIIKQSVSKHEHYTQITSLKSLNCCEELVRY